MATAGNLGAHHAFMETEGLRRRIWNGRLFGREEWMSERGVAFIERWIAEHIPLAARPGETSEAALTDLARQAMHDAADAGIAGTEITEELPDRPARLADAVAV